MKAYIVDDESDSRELIKFLLKSKFPQIQIVGESPTVMDSIEFLKKNTIDVLFLDIHLDGATGFEVLQNIEINNINIIFITAYSQFAIEAIKNNALDYILKPIDREEFDEAVQKAILKKNENLKKQLNELLTNSAQLDRKEENSKTRSVKLNKIVLLVGNKYELVDFDNIIRLKSDNNYTMFFLKDNRNILTSKPLKYYEELLPENKFVRTHQSHLVNVDYIKEFEKGKHAVLTMFDGSSIEVSNARKEEIFRLLGI
jgi:two-component system LytT family response regulator